MAKFMATGFADFDKEKAGRVVLVLWLKAGRVVLVLWLKAGRVVLVLWLKAGRVVLVLWLKAADNLGDSVVCEIHCCYTIAYVIEVLSSSTLR